MSDINLGLSLRDIIICRCVFTVWLDVLFPSQVGILASANTSCIRAHVTSVLNLPRFYLKKMAMPWHCLVGRQQLIIMKSAHTFYHTSLFRMLSRFSLCLSCKIHLFTSNPLCGAHLSHPTCEAYLLSLLHNEWLSGALTVHRHHVSCPEKLLLHIQTPSYNSYILMLL